MAAGSGSTLQRSPVRRPFSTRRRAPGLIYDGIATTPDSFVSRRDDWIGFTKVWFRTVDYITDPENRAEVLRIIAGGSRLTPEECGPLLKGTFL